MNQDFGLLATPANARRLLLFQDVCRITVAPEIVALADQERLDEQMFDPLVCPYSETRHTIAQFLMDCDLRGVVQVAYHPEITPLAMLNTVRLRADPVVVVTARRKPWSMAATALGLSVHIIGSLLTLERDIGEVNRRAVLIIDIDAGIVSTLLRNIAREFRHFIIYDSVDLEQMSPWSVWCQMLFPTMPHPFIPRLLKDVPAAWQSRPLVAFAVLYNVCIFPKLITSPAILAAIEDDYFIRRGRSSLLT